MNIETTPTGTEYDFCLKCKNDGDNTNLFFDYDSKKWICEECLNKLTEAEELIKDMQEVYKKC